MELQRVDNNTFKNYFPSPNHVFNLVCFSDLNKDKCNDLHYLLFRDNKKVRLGIILGEREDSLCSPFSAPFGGFSYNKNEKIEYFEQAVTLLKEYGLVYHKQIKISLPPMIYNSTSISKTISALTRNGASVKYIDLNYQFELDKFADYENIIDSRTKNKLHNSQRNNFVFQQLDSKKESDVARAYSVIKHNREERGFPLRMSLEAVLDTIRVVFADFFVLSYDGVDVAAAQVFHVSESIVQVIYWGDLPKYSNLRVMNYFSYKIFEHYYNKGVKILDIGPSTEEGIPNYGLCEFKESIGCTVSAKYTFLL